MLAELSRRLRRTRDLAVQRYGASGDQQFARHWMFHFAQVTVDPGLLAAVRATPFPIETITVEALSSGARSMANA